MRRILVGLMVAAVAGSGVVAASTADAQARKPAARTKAKPKPPPEPPPPVYEPQERLKTSDDLKRESVGGAVTTPLRDLNLEKTDIPQILQDALNDPYARPPRGYGCAYLVALVRPLDDVLGPDIDKLPAGDENLLNRGKSGALGAAADVATGALIPFRGVVRKVTGAESHDRLVQSAIVAGNVRRAYLKGLGEAKGCNPPATPSHERASVTAAADKREPLKPKYPTRTDELQKSDETPPAARQR